MIVAAGETNKICWLSTAGERNTTMLRQLTIGRAILVAALCAVLFLTRGVNAGEPEALKAKIETLRDAKVVWRKVEWRTCLLGALNEAAREKKPVFLWVLGGAPADGRC
jgi:hypothetical protein